MNNVLLIFIIGLLIIILIGGAIFFISKKVLTPPSSKPPKEVCGGNNECSKGEICSKTGFCIPEGTCAVNGDCSAGVCLNSQCVPEKCEVDGDCGNNFCIEGNCVARCTNDSSCLGSSVCRNGLCQKKHCILQSDCNFDEACTNESATYGGVLNPKLTEPSEVGTCLPVLNSCITNLDCAGNLQCKKGACVQCTTNEDCPHNLVCRRGGICLHPEQEGCPLGLVQTNACPGEDCGYTLCCPSSCGKIRCTESVHCTNKNCPYCVGGFCTCKPAPILPREHICVRNEDCEEGLICVTESGGFPPPISIAAGPNICAKPDPPCETLYGRKCITSLGSEVTKEDNGYIGLSRCLKDSNVPYCNLETNCCVDGSNKHNVRCGDGVECVTGFCSSGYCFCVNGFCTNKLGSYGDRCLYDRDCLSNVCNTKLPVPICE